MFDVKAEARIRARDFYLIEIRLLTYSQNVDRVHNLRELGARTTYVSGHRYPLGIVPSVNHQVS